MRKERVRNRLHVLDRSGSPADLDLLWDQFFSQLPETSDRSSPLRGNRFLHGTRASFVSFSDEHSKTAFGTFMTRTPDVAVYYAVDRNKGRVMEVALRIPPSLVADLTNPVVFESVLASTWIDESEWDFVREAHDAGELYNQSMGRWQNSLLQSAERLGYRGAVFFDTTARHRDLSFVVFDPADVAVVDPEWEIPADYALTTSW